MTDPQDSVPRAEDGQLDPRRLAGVAELAKLFQVGRTTVSNWHDRRGRNGFPSPVAVLAMGPVWDIDAVVRWYGRYVPSKGGRPGTAPRLKDGTYAPGRAS